MIRELDRPFEDGRIEDSESMAPKPCYILW